MIKGETIGSGGSSTCLDCKKELNLKVLQSDAGYYVGTRCDCGPYSRESGYYRNEAEAKTCLAALQKDLTDPTYARS